MSPTAVKLKQLPARKILHKEIGQSNVPRPRKFSEALFNAALLKLVVFLDRTQKRETKTTFTYTQSRKYVAYSLVSSFIKGEKFSATECAKEKDMNRVNVQKILREAREMGYTTACNQPTQEGYDRLLATVEEWLHSPELNDLVATIASAKHMMNMRRDNWE